MSLQLLFWTLMLFWLVFGMWSTYVPGQPCPVRAWGGEHLVVHPVPDSWLADIRRARKVTYGSLFTGIGGIDLGLDSAGFRCRWQVENDPYAVKVLEKHWPDVKRYGDITGVTGDDLEPVDLICGGFPCQISAKPGKERHRGKLEVLFGLEYARLVRELRPRFLLIENVPGLLVSDAMRRVVGELARLGYVGCWRSLRASEFGASHLRKRGVHCGLPLRGTMHRGGKTPEQIESMRERTGAGVFNLNKAAEHWVGRTPTTDAGRDRMRHRRRERT